MLHHAICGCARRKQDKQQYQMWLVLIVLAASDVMVSIGVCRQWVVAAVAAGMLQWYDIPRYTRRVDGICGFPILQYIRCCSPDFNLIMPKEPRTAALVLDDFLPPTVHDPVCGYAIADCCQPTFHSEDLEFLGITGETLFGAAQSNVPTNIWTIVAICGLCVVGLAILTHFGLEV
jgi:hypothetical protein